MGLMSPFRAIEKDIPWPARTLSVWSVLYLLMMLVVGGLGVYVGGGQEDAKCFVSSEKETLDLGPLALCMTATGAAMLLLSLIVLFLSHVARGMRPDNYAGGNFPTEGLVYQGLCGVVYVSCPTVVFGFAALHYLVFFSNVSCEANRFGNPDTLLPAKAYPMIIAMWVLLLGCVGQMLFCQAPKRVNLHEDVPPREIDEPHAGGYGTD
jgi:hypothetical protein